MEKQTILLTRHVAQLVRENRYKIAPIYQATYRSELARIPESRFHQATFLAAIFTSTPCVTRLDVATSAAVGEMRGDREIDPRRDPTAWTILLVFEARGERNVTRIDTGIVRVLQSRWI